MFWHGYGICRKLFRKTFQVLDSYWSVMLTSDGSPEVY
uniref:Uncharacterized protein n=1 Tax=Anguilla anguilla TaxID=7936 RepID=A0A0E9QVB7_ANGAN